MWPYFHTVFHFSDNLSPPMLVYNAQTLVLKHVKFLHNWPRYLSPDISQDSCYFSGGEEVFFLDNRTTSGGISAYNKNTQLYLLILGSIYLNNTARPDFDISLPHASDGYGHGGATTLRFLNSSGGCVCVKDSHFEENSAQAHAGAISIAMGISNRNRVMIFNCSFKRNLCKVEECTGGAIGVQFYAKTVYNQLYILESNFMNNEAQSGGAVSLLTFVSSDGNSDSLTLEKCTFQSNKAFFEGTALSVFSLVHADQIGFPLILSDW